MKTTTLILAATLALAAVALATPSASASNFCVATKLTDCPGLVCYPDLNGRMRCLYAYNPCDFQECPPDS